MPSLHALVRSLRRDVLRLRKAAAKPPSQPRRHEGAPSDLRLLTCNECDRLYRRREGTAAAAYHAGLLPGRWTGAPTKGRPGKTLLVSAKHAAELSDAEYRR